MREEIVSSVRQETIPEDKLTNGGTRLMLGSEYVPLAIMHKASHGSCLAAREDSAPPRALDVCTFFG